LPEAVIPGQNPIMVTKPILDNSGNLTDTERHIISLILTEHFNDGGYNIVSPEMNLSYAGGFIAALTEYWSKEIVIRKFKEKGYDVSVLFDELFKINSGNQTMDIPSSISDGYLIDYKHKFKTYFGPDKDGWENFRATNPKANAYIVISLPVYDPATQVVLVYFSAASGWMEAGGDFRAYKYNGTKLEEIGRANIWIS
jgi:hypothetical protein